MYTAQEVHPKREEKTRVQAQVAVEEKSQLKERCRHLIDENSSEEHPLGCRLHLHGLGVEELVAVAGVPPLLRPDEPRQEPPNLLLVAALLLLLPFRGFLTGRHQRLREGGDVDEGGSGRGRASEDVDRADVRRQRDMVRRRR
jgi:hypothetical protein